MILYVLAVSGDDVVYSDAHSFWLDERRFCFQGVPNVPVIHYPPIRPSSQCILVSFFLKFQCAVFSFIVSCEAYLAFATRAVILVF